MAGPKKIPIDTVYPNTTVQVDITMSDDVSRRVFFKFGTADLGMSQHNSIPQVAISWDIGGVNNVGFIGAFHLGNPIAVFTQITAICEFVLFPARITTVNQLDGGQDVTIFLYELNE